MESNSPPARAPHTIPLLLLAVLILSVLVMGPLYYRYSGPTDTQDDATRCRANLQSIARALERNAAAHQKHYPRKLSELVPDNLSRIPKCPTVDIDTYSAGYFVSEDRKSYRLECSGHHHGKSSPSISGPPARSNGN